MADLSVIDRFTETFSRYIDSGFGTLGGDVSFLSSTLVAIDLTLAGLAWSLRGDEQIVVALAKKVLYVGAFAFIIGNFKSLADIVFNSFSGIGLKAGGGSLTAADLMRPGFVASAGFTAAHPLLEETSQFSGFDVLTNLPTILILLLCWILIVLAFFVLSVQLFVTLIEFKLTTLASFILVPFALWGKTSFLAEKTLGNVVASGQGHGARDHRRHRIDDLRRVGDDADPASRHHVGHESAACCDFVAWTRHLWSRHRGRPGVGSAPAWRGCGCRHGCGSGCCYDRWCCSCRRRLASGRRWLG